VSRITQLDALEILDSRGRPTLAVTVGLDGRVVETVSVPSGASTGKAEAKELRDQDKRYRGLGTRKAVANVCGLIASALVGREFASPWSTGLEHRAVKHTSACLLARAVGRSPLEYLNDSERAAQTQAALDLIEAAPATLSELVEIFARRIMS